VAENGLLETMFKSLLDEFPLNDGLLLIFDEDMIVIGIDVSVLYKLLAVVLVALVVVSIFVDGVLLILFS
jgi:hypothetical protein